MGDEAGLTPVRDPEGAADTADAQAVRRVRWEKGFAAYDVTASPVAALRAVARALSCSEQEARGLVEVGIPELGLVGYRERAADAVRAVVAADRRRLTGEAAERATSVALAEGRAVAASKAAAAQARVLGDAVEQAAAEVRVVRGVRQTASAMLQLEGNLLRAASILSTSVLRELDPAHGGNPAALPLGKRVQLVRDVAAIVKATAETAKIAVQAERLILGKPTNIIGTGEPTSAMSPEEALVFVELASRATARAMAREAKRAARGEVIDVGPDEVTGEDLEAELAP